MSTDLVVQNPTTLAVSAAAPEGLPLQALEYGGAQAAMAVLKLGPGHELEMSNVLAAACEQIVTQLAQTSNENVALLIDAIRAAGFEFTWYGGSTDKWYVYGSASEVTGALRRKETVRISRAYDDLQLSSIPGLYAWWSRRGPAVAQLDVTLAQLPRYEYFRSWIAHAISNTDGATIDDDHYKNPKNVLRAVLEGKRVLMPDCGRGCQWVKSLEQLDAWIEETFHPGRPAEPGLWQRLKARIASRKPSAVDERLLKALPSQLESLLAASDTRDAATGSVDPYFDHGQDLYIGKHGERLLQVPLKEGATAIVDPVTNTFYHLEPIEWEQAPQALGGPYVLPRGLTFPSGSYGEAKIRAMQHLLTPKK